MASSPKAPADPIDARLVRQLADILTETGLTEIEVEHNDLKIRVAKTAAPTAVQYAPAPAYAAAPAPAAAPVAGETAPAAVERKGDVVKSPMVGTVYLQPQPDAPAFVKVGDTVTAGQTLLIVEAMKTMNPIQAPRDGVVAEILVGDAQPVEFGEPLVLLEA